MNAEILLQHFDRIGEAPDAIPRLRRFILDLAVRGKLVAQDPEDEPAAELLKRIQTEKARLVKEGEIKKLDPVVVDRDSKFSMELPERWETTTLLSVCSSVTDGDHPPPPKADSGVPFLVIGNVRSQRIDFTGCRYVPRDYYEALDSIRRPRYGDLLYTLVGSYGIPVPVLDSQQFCVQRHIGILRPMKLIDAAFLARVLESDWVFNQAMKCATGIAQKTVPLAGLRKIVISLPPLAEQHRIVAKVDELMALCDQLEAARNEREVRRNRLVAASLNRIGTTTADEAKDAARFHLDHLSRLTTRPEHIKQLRQTILNLAVRGRLVPQDPNDEPAAELLKRIQAEKDDFTPRRQGAKESQDVFSPPFDTPNNWQWVRVTDCFNVSGGIQKTPNRAPQANPYPYLGVGNVYRGRLDLSNVKKFELLNGELEKFRLMAGDILVVEGNGSASEIGRCAIWNGEIEDCVHQNHIIRCHPYNLAISPFVLRYLNSPSGIEAMQILAVTSSGLFNLSVGKIKAILIPLPPLAEQHRIVAKVDELMALCDQLEAQLATTEADSRRLLEAVLRDALTPVIGAALV